MRLYTINATPLRAGDDQQTVADKLVSYKGVVAGILSKHGVDGFTIYKVDGYWMGEAEDSFKIEVALDDSACDGEPTALMAMICENLRDEYDQDAVMLTLPDNSVHFIERM